MKYHNIGIRTTIKNQYAKFQSFVCFVMRGSRVRVPQVAQRVLEIYISMSYENRNE